MGEHQSGWQKTLHEKTGQDVYFWNFIFLMVFTAIEVGAVYLSLTYGWTVFALVSVGVVKFFGIAAFFMHLWDDERELTYTFAFPFIFVIILFIGIAFTNPEGVIGLPAWCSPDIIGSYTSTSP
ncbi:MAG: hypothetical protein CMA34_01755 [Euryarchaeota archaeon]|nr:hypothetical protein [Euryarchaeota archaeon]|tara:strand:+ start:500 stop:871 length:372 start_codon:yes stop_codon:yes gene_type:complete